MHLLIVEDERPIALYTERLCRLLLGTKIELVSTKYTLEQASSFLFKHHIDLCLLDLNLNGCNGYELLKMAVSGSFHTIIISAHTDQAIEAFKYGVLDFVPKPFDEKRLRSAFAKYFGRIQRQELTTKYLSVRKGNEFNLLSIKDIGYFKAAGVYVEAHLKNSNIEILDKTMDRLEQILPARFVRIHRSCIVNLELIESYKHVGGGTYQVCLKNHEVLPLSRQKYKELHNLMVS